MAMANLNSRTVVLTICIFILFVKNINAHSRDNSGFYLPDQKSNSYQISSLIIEFSSPNSVILNITYSSEKKSIYFLEKIPAIKPFIFKYDTENIYLSSNKSLILIVPNIFNDALLLFSKQAQPAVFNLHYDNQFTDPFTGRENKEDERTLETKLLGDSILCFHLEIDTHNGSGSLSGMAIKTNSNEFTYYEYPANSAYLRKEHPDIIDYSCIIIFIKEPDSFSVIESHCSEWHGTPVMFDGVYEKASNH